MLCSWTGKYTCGDSPMEHPIGPLVIPDSEMCCYSASLLMRNLIYNVFYEKRRRFDKYASHWTSAVSLVSLSHMLLCLLL